MINHDFTYCALNLHIDAWDRKEMTKEALNVPKEMWHFDKFRGTSILWVYNGGGRLGKHDVENHKDFDFTEAAKLMPHTVDILENIIFPFMKPPGRVVILDTPPKTPLNIHIDAKEQEVGSKQHKFRIALDGTVDTLYFLDENNDKIYVPGQYNTYIMDGGHPHSIDGDKRKVTLCIGSPWRGQTTDSYEQLLQCSPHIMNITRPKIKEEWVDPRYDKENR